MTDPSADARFVDNCVEGCARAHQRLLNVIDEVPEAERDAWIASPSLLPGWSRAHVLAHLSRNADSHVHLFSEAEKGVQGEQYPGGKAFREEGIQADAKLSASALFHRVRSSIYALEGTWATSSALAWQGTGRQSTGAVIKAMDFPLLRWREVEVHTVDLDCRVTFRDWDPVYVRYDLPRQEMRVTSRAPMGMTTLPAEALALPETERLAWLMGRHVPAGLDKLEGF